MALPSDNFNSYANATALATLNGGSGWSGAWVDGGSSNWTTESGTVQEGAEAVTSASGATDRFISRPFTAVGTGQFRIWFRMAGTGGEVDIGLGTTDFANANARCSVRFASDGNAYQFHDAFAENTILAYSANTWYAVDYSWNSAAGTYQVSITTTGVTSYGTAANFVNGGTSNLGAVGFHRSNNVSGNDAFVDNIGPTPVSTATLPYRALLGVGI